MKSIGKQKIILLISAIVVIVAGLLFFPRPKLIQVACTSTFTPNNYSNCERQLIWEQSFLIKQITNTIFSFFNRNCTGFCGFYGNDLIVPPPTISPTHKPNEFQVESGKYITDEEGAIVIVKQYFPEVKKIQKTQSAIGQIMDIKTKETLEKDGWRILFWQGSGDCPAGCLNNQQWYFIVTKTGIIRKVGESKRVFNSKKNAIDENGLFLPYFLDDCPSQKVLDCTNLNDPDRHWRCQQPYFDWLKTTCPDVTVLQP